MIAFRTRYAGTHTDSIKCSVTEIAALRSVQLQHEAIEERRELRMAVERENMRDILIRPNHDHAARFSIDAAQREDVVIACEIGAEHLFVIAKTETSLPRQKQW